MSKSKAKNKADAKLQEDDLTEFMEEYGVLILKMLRLRHGRLHAEIMDWVDSYIGDGIDRKRAIRTVLRKHRSEFEEYLRSTDEEDAEAEDDSDNDDDGEGESDDEDEVDS